MIVWASTLEGVGEGIVRRDVLVSRTASSRNRGFHRKGPLLHASRTKDSLTLIGEPKGLPGKSEAALDDGPRKYRAVNLDEFSQRRERG